MKDKTKKGGVRIKMIIGQIMWSEKDYLTLKKDVFFSKERYLIWKDVFLVSKTSFLSKISYSASKTIFVRK